MDALEANSLRYHPSPPPKPHVGELRYLDFDVGERWRSQVLASPPDPPASVRISSVYFSGALEIRTNPGLYAGTYDFQGSGDRFETGEQVLTASGRRPDCAMGDPANVYRTLPPRNGWRPFVIKPSELMRYLDVAEVAGYQEWIEDPTMVVRISTCAFFRNRVGASLSPEHRAGFSNENTGLDFRMDSPGHRAGVTQVGPEGLPRTQGWLFRRRPLRRPAGISGGRRGSSCAASGGAMRY